MFTIRANQGDRMVYGASTFHNPTAEPMTLATAQPVGDVPTSVATVIEVLAVDSPLVGNESMAAAQGPLPKYARRASPVEGYVVEPGASAELLFILDIHEDGQWEWSRTSVE